MDLIKSEQGDSPIKPKSRSVTRSDRAKSKNPPSAAQPTLSPEAMAIVANLDKQTSTEAAMIALVQGNYDLVLNAKISQELEALRPQIEARLAEQQRELDDQRQRHIEVVSNFANNFLNQYGLSVESEG